MNSDIWHVCKSLVMAASSSAPHQRKGVHELHCEIWEQHSHLCLSSARIYFGAWCFLISAETAEPGTKAPQMHTLDNCPVLYWPCASAACVSGIAPNPGPIVRSHSSLHLTFIFSFLCLQPQTVLKSFRFFMISCWIWLEKSSKFDQSELWKRVQCVCTWGVVVKFSSYEQTALH